MYYGERFNAHTHLAGTVLALGGASALVVNALVKADALRLVSFSVYGATLCLLFLASTLYHSTQGEAKNLFRKLDYCAIYLVIAGTYTPFALISLQGDWSWTLLGAVWALAFVGIVQECWIARGRRFTSLAIYLLMGWLAIFALEPLAQALSFDGLAWMIGGGLVYSAGIIFYLYDERFTHWHGIWHLFVLAGSIAHYTAIVLFVA
ncbi:MAG TPA: hemolysin III family protein [Usitatibacter sp.]|nr:hemolysin III family protein [Usitatibacter sp.]